MKSNVTVLLMALTDASTDAVIDAFGDLQINFLKSNPSYNNYLKTLQYLPDAIIIEMPKNYYDQLHFVQMVKQNTIASDIPIICFGDGIEKNIEDGIKKVGVDEYIKRPFDMKFLADSVVERIKKKGIIPKVKSYSPEKEKKIDIDKLLSAYTPKEKKIELMMKYISEVMAFPFTVSMALQLLRNENSEVNDLAKIIETDPTISANFLKKANSIYFAGRHTRTATIKDAIVRIGFSETRRIITGMAVMQIFDASKHNPGFNRLDFWYHCVATAKIAEYFAGRSRIINPSEAFLAGIMHDFGIILLDEFFPEIFSLILQISTDYGRRFYDVEKDILTITHNDIVDLLFKQWKIPETITYAVVNHYTILQSNISSPSEKEIMSVIVSIANILAKTFRIGISCDSFVFPIDNRYFSFLNAPLGPPEDLFQRISEQLDKYKELLKLEEKPEERNDHYTSAVAPVFNVGIADFSASVFNPIEQYLRLGRYNIISISVSSESYEVYNNQCDIILAFTDNKTKPESILSLMKIERRLSSENTEGPLKGKGVPLIVFVDKEKPSPAIINISGISLLPAEIDLRMLDVHIDKAVRGKIVKSLPWESIIKPRITDLKEKDTTLKDMQEAYRILRHFKERCTELHIVSDDILLAESYISQAQIKQNENNHSDAYKLISLATEYYRRSYLTHELEKCTKNIAVREEELKKGCKK